MTPNKENLQKVLNVMGVEAEFGMADWMIGKAEPHCGTVACIGGTAEIVMRAEGVGPPTETIWYDEADVSAWLGISDSAGEDTFFPANMTSKGYYKVTLEDAQQVVRNLMEHGEPRWEEVRPDLMEDDPR